MSKVVGVQKMATKYKQQLSKLLSIPKIEQKTDEWYKMRHTMITASDFAQALGEGKFGTVKQFYQKKCEVLPDDAAASKSNPFFKWGNMFEPVACDVYSHMHDKITIHEFGLLKHSKYDYFGASPDGISELGVMLEIKCPKKRKIDGEIPMQYYYQIQGQLDVCDLDECDYFECEFVTHDTVEEFLESTHDYYGIILEEDGKYIYSSLDTSKSDLLIWKEANAGNKIVVYWSLKAYNIKRVQRDKKWVQAKLKELGNVWANVLRYRQDRDLYEKEVLKTMFIETQRYTPQELNNAPAPNEWTFRDFD